MSTLHKLSLVVFAVALTACNQGDDSDSGEKVSKQALRETSSLQFLSDDLLNIAEDELNSGGYGGRPATSASRGIDVGCANISWDGVDTVTIDFGTDGTCEFNSRIHKGKISYQYAGLYFITGGSITVTLEGFEVETSADSGEFIGLSGTKTVTNLGLVDGMKTWSIVDSGFVLTQEDGSTQTWDSDRTRILFDAGSANPFDEIYHSYGTTEGTTSAGEEYAAVTTSDDPLVLDIACALTTGMPVDGSITLSVGRKADRIIDFGYQAEEGEECDRSVSVTVGKTVVPISF